MSGPTIITEQMFRGFLNRRGRATCRRSMTRESWTCPKCKLSFFMKYKPRACNEHEGEEEVCYE